MKTTFLDTSYLLAIVNADDALYERAVAWKASVRGRLLTTEFVLLEFLDALSQPPMRGRALDALMVLRTDPGLSIVPVSSALLNEGIRFFTAHQDKPWGLTDCTSFQVMTREGLTEALTADRHFEQAGFRALLRYDPEER